jgi:hypothetical protein
MQVTSRKICYVAPVNRSRKTASNFRLGPETLSHVCTLWTGKPQSVVIFQLYESMCSQLRPRMGVVTCKRADANRQSLTGIN